MDISKLLLAQLGEGGIEAVAQKIGADKGQTTLALEGIVPTFLGAMSNNTKSESGASGLLGALDTDHDGSILDDVAGFIGKSDDGDGDGILSHVLGNNRNSVETGLSSKTGLNTVQVGNLLKIAAPLIMGYLGKQKKEASSGFDLSSLTGLLGGMSQTSNDGTSMDLGDILSVVGNFTGGNNTAKNGGGIGGLLGKLFGR